MIKTEIFLSPGYKEEDVKEAVSAKLPIDKGEISELRIVKRVLIKSRGEAAKYKTSVAISLDPEREAGLLKMRKKVFPMEDLKLDIKAVGTSERPVVVGSGPCGLFAALTLAKAGAKPIVLERGLDVSERAAAIRRFEALGILDVECNVQFGEGGAGTYSDGKLKVGSMDKYKWEVLSEFISAGAPEDIAYSDSAHLGTDKLPGIVRKIREKIISLGGEFIFGARLDSFGMSFGELRYLVYEKQGKKIRLDAKNLILAIGHSAKDTFGYLHSIGVPMIAKGFGVGVRIEHKREYINSLVYGSDPEPELGSASYHLVTHLKNGRSVYSFCMCPGGSVVAAASETGGIVTNGMSEYSRMAENSNAALLVSVTPEDFGSDSPIAGLEFRRKIEESAFTLAGSDYSAPAMSLGSFLQGGAPSLGAVRPSYPRSVRAADIRRAVPEYIGESLAAAIPDFDAWLPGYNIPDALITAPETRSTSPIRIIRDEKREAVGFSGIYPSGEGAGYAGGIVSSAVDGIRSAEALIEKLTEA